MSTLLDPQAVALAFALAASIALCTWIASVARRDASIVDSVWSLMIFAAVIGYALFTTGGPRTIWLLPLVGLWAARLCAHITWRNHGQPEDRRYQAIRARNQPGYALKSLYLVFGLQAVLAWIVALPVMAGVAAPEPVSALDALGAAIVVFGLVFETVADAQLARFRASPLSVGQVMNSGLWRYSRHPNYFGECCVWWGFWVIALASGAAWTVISPLLMTWLLLKISGVTLLEQGMAARRPAYAEYVRRTNAFFPGPRRAHCALAAPGAPNEGEARVATAATGQCAQSRP